MIHVFGLSFTEAGVEFTFADGDSLRKDGALQVVQVLNVAPHPDYAEAIADLIDKAEALVKDAMEDWHTSPPVDLAEDEGGDPDEPGMGWDG